MNGDGLSCQHRAGNAQATAAGQALTHALKRPEKVDSGGPRLGQALNMGSNLIPPVRVMRNLKRGERYAISCGDAYRRGSAHGHATDPLYHRFNIRTFQPYLFRWEQTLVKHAQTAVLPDQGVNFFWGIFMRHEISGETAKRRGWHYKEDCLSTVIPPGSGLRQVGAMPVTGPDQAGILRDTLDRPDTGKFPLAHRTSRANGAR